MSALVATLPCDSCSGVEQSAPYGVADAVAQSLANPPTMRGCWVAVPLTHMEDPRYVVAVFDAAIADVAAAPASARAESNTAVARVMTLSPSRPIPSDC